MQGFDTKKSSKSCKEAGHKLRAVVYWKIGRDAVWNGPMIEEDAHNMHQCGIKKEKSSGRFGVTFCDYASIMVFSCSFQKSA